MKSTRFTLRKLAEIGKPYRTYSMHPDPKRVVNSTASGAINWGPLYVDRPGTGKYVGTEASGVTYRLEVKDPDKHVKLTVVGRDRKPIMTWTHSAQTKVPGLPQLARTVMVSPVGAARKKPKTRTVP